jgi:phosphatidylserine decarboxylase
VAGGETLISTKGDKEFKINELSKIEMIKAPCWLVGITMTLFDVHYIRSPIGGEIVLNKYTKGKFMSLKMAGSEVENERNTVVIENSKYRIAVVEIASRRVRGIRTYVNKGQTVQMGQRIGMITFGSQTDVILPIQAPPRVCVGQWVYGGKTIIAAVDSC